MGNPVVHFEVIGSDREGLQKFYGELFGWHIEGNAELQYGMIDTHAGEGINGGLGQLMQPGAQQYTTFYIEVPDLEAALKKIESLGGKRLMDPMEIPNVVSFALFNDPQGNLLGIVSAGEGPGVSKGDGVSVGWFEVLGTDGPALRKFYADAFGWSFKESMGEGFDYGEADTKSDGRGIPGGVGTSQGEPAQTVYAGVDDVAKYLERAETLGGTKVMGPMDVGGGTEVGAFKDPQGNLFGLFKHTHPH